MIINYEEQGRNEEEPVKENTNLPANFAIVNSSI